MVHLIQSHQTRPADDLIFALSSEAQRRRAAGESIVNATLGSLMTDEGKLAVLDTASRALHEVPREEWAAYAPIAGTGDFLAAVIHDTLNSQPTLKACATAAATPGGSGALRHAIANYLEPGQALLTTSSYWGPYQTLCDEQERTLETFSMFNAEGALDVAALDAKVGELLERQGRVLLFLNDPCNNPTGYSMQRREWTAVANCLAAHARKGPVTLLADMAYWQYGSGDPRAFLAELVPLLGRVGLLFAWSASKSFTHYGLRVGALIACVPDDLERRATAAAFSYSCRGTWSNCNRGGLTLITRLLTDPVLSKACDTERDQLKALLARRVAAFNTHAAKKLKYPRYEGGFFVTVFADDALARAERMKGLGVYVVPSKTSLRVAICSVAEKDIGRVVDALAS